MASVRRPVKHPLFARAYARMSARHEPRGVAEHRRTLVEGLTGRVLELGAGTGLNFAHYPQSVREVIALEPEPYLRSRAQVAAAKAAVMIRVIDGVGEAIPAPDASFDYAVAALVLCSVADQREVLRELRRVIRPGGELRYYEHVVAHGAQAALVQRALDATVWPRVAGGCHMARDTGAALRGAGFKVTAERRIAVDLIGSAVTLPHLLGVAQRP